MITLKEAHEKDISTLANIFSAINIEQNWTYDSSLSYLQYFYKYQPDLFICAYDDNIPIGAIISTLKPFSDGMHLSSVELFVSEDYINQNIEEKLLEAQLEVANSKYHASYINTITNTNSSVSWHEKIGLKPISNLVILKGDLKYCLKKIREKI